MFTRFFLIHVSFIVLSMLATNGSASTVIHAGRLIDGLGGPAKQRVSIVVDQNIISSIKPGFIQAKPTDSLIDLSEYTLLPGLMDMHVHLSHQLKKNGYIERFTLNPADYALQAAYYAEKTLLAGFTTVRNLGDHGNETIALRKAIAAGLHKGPRIYTAGTSIATTGGHADPSNGHSQLLMDLIGSSGVINSAAQARQAVRQRYKVGADVIKITATGGVLSLAKNGQNPQFRAHELSALMEVAKDYGLTVAAHAHGKEGMRRSIIAGVTSIEHGSFMDDEIMALMIKHQTYLVPTISAGKFVALKAQEKDFFPAQVRVKAREIGPLIEKMFTKAYRQGVKIAFGTDSGVSPHGDNAKEFIYMLEGGMSASDAIQSATIEAAKLLGIDDQLGSVSSGKLADLIAVRDNPLKNIETLSHVVFVMKDGKVYKTP